MARYRDISSLPSKRKKLRAFTAAVLLLGVIFPFAFSMIFGQSRALNSDSAELAVEVQNRGTDDSGKRCWEASAETHEKNVLGFKVATNNFRAQWCALNGELTEQAGSTTYRSRVLGWDMASTETRIKDSTITVVQPLKYDFLNFSTGFNRTVEFTVDTEGNAKAVTY